MHSLFDTRGDGADKVTPFEYYVLYTAGENFGEPYSKSHILVRRNLANKLLQSVHIPNTFSVYL